jgi:hypothetical protein
MTVASSPWPRNTASAHKLYSSDCRAWVTSASRFRAHGVSFKIASSKSFCRSNVFDIDDVVASFHGIRPVTGQRIRRREAIRRGACCGREVRVLHLGSVCELSGAPRENRRILYRQNEVQETQCSLFPIYRRLPKLDRQTVASSVGKDSCRGLRDSPTLHTSRTTTLSHQTASGTKHGFRLQRTADEANRWPRPFTGSSCLPLVRHQGTESRDRHGVRVSDTSADRDVPECDIVGFLRSDVWPTPLVKTVCFGHMSERAISIFIFIVEVVILVGCFWYVVRVRGRSRSRKITDRGI